MTAPTTRETADHAELTRLAEAAVLCAKPDEEPWFEEWQFPHLDKAEREFIAAMSPAVCSALLSEIAALRGSLIKANSGFEEYERKFYLEQDDREQAERQRDELRKALERAADDLRDIGGQSPRPSNSPDPEHENYLRRVLISLGQVGNTRARQALANQGADQ